MCSEFSLPDGNVGKNGITGVDMSSFTHIDKKKKDNLIFDIGPTQGLNDIILTVEGQYSINFSGSYKEFCLSLHYNGSNSLFVNATKLYQLKAKDSEIKIYPLCLGNISGDFSANNATKNRIKWVCAQFFGWL